MKVPRRYKWLGLAVIVTLVVSGIGLAGEMFLWGGWPPETPLSWRLPSWTPGRAHVSAWEARRDAEAAAADGRWLTFGYSRDGTGLGLPESCRVVENAYRVDGPAPVPEWFTGLSGRIELECEGADGARRGTFTNVEMGCIGCTECDYTLVFNREIVRLALREE